MPRICPEQGIICPIIKNKMYTYLCNSLIFWNSNVGKGIQVNIHIYIKLYVYTVLKCINQNDTLLSDIHIVKTHSSLHPCQSSIIFYFIAVLDSLFNFQKVSFLILYTNPTFHSLSSSCFLHPTPNSQPHIREGKASHRVSTKSSTLL